MLTDRGMQSLRRAATLAHVFPTVRLRLRDGDRVVVEVARPPFHNADPEARLIPSCPFHASVGRAHRQLREGRQMAYSGVPQDHEPSIDIGLPTGDLNTGDGRYRLTWDNEQHHVLLTTLDQHDTEGVLRSDDLPSLPPYLRWVTWPDDTTGVTMVHVTTDPTDPTAGDIAQAWLLEVLGRVSAEELIQSLEVGQLR